jgi:hypothetical protein
LGIKQAFPEKANEQTAYELLQDIKEDYNSLRRSVHDGLYSNKSEGLLNDLHPTLKGILKVLEMLEEKTAEEAEG